MGNNGALTIPANITGNPAVSIPIEPFQGLPVGMQVIGRHHQDQLLLDLALVAERTCPWPLWRRVPRTDPPHEPGPTRRPSPPQRVGRNIEHLYDDGCWASPPGASLVTPPVEDADMAEQLPLVDINSAWRIDERTKEVGRRGIASA